MIACSRVLSRRMTARIRNHFLFFIGLSLLSATSPVSARPSWAQDAPCSPYCSAPSAPATSGPSHDLDGNYTVSAYDETGSAAYGWVEFDGGGGAVNPSSGTTANLSVTNKPTGTHTHRAKACLGNNGGEVCSAYGSTATVYVVRAPGDPGITASAGSCGNLSVSWSAAASGYPAPTHEKRYDLQESTDNGNTWNGVSGRINTTTTSWTHPDPAASFSYRYRVRAFYVWNGYTSAQTGWINTTITSAACPPFIPNAPVLSQPVITGTDVALSWSAPSSGGYTLNYPLERRDVTANSAWAQVYAGTVTGYNDTAAKTRGNRYEYRVRACTPVPNCSAWSATGSFSLYQVVDLGYEYDDLGRLIRLVQDGSTKVGYCYDPAGNRRQVSANGGGGEDCPAMPPPTGLSVTWWTGPTWKIDWNPVISATGYKIRLNNGTILNVSGGSTATAYSQPGANEPPENARPDWIQACFADSSCGALAYFPN